METEIYTLEISDLRKVVTRCTSGRVFLFSNYNYVSEILSLPILKTKGNIPITLMPNAKLHTPEEN